MGLHLFLLSLMFHTWLCQLFPSSLYEATEFVWLHPWSYLIPSQAVCHCCWVSYALQKLSYRLLNIKVSFHFGQHEAHPSCVSSLRPRPFPVPDEPKHPEVCKNTSAVSWDPAALPSQWAFWRGPLQESWSSALPGLCLLNLGLQLPPSPQPLWGLAVVS